MSGSDARALSRSLLDLCRMRKLTIATAESCTGGMVAAALTDIPGSSDVIDRGFGRLANDVIGATPGLHHLGGYRDEDVVIEVFDTAPPVSVAARTGVPGA